MKFHFNRPNCPFWTCSWSSLWRWRLRLQLSFGDRATWIRGIWLEPEPSLSLSLGSSLNFSLIIHANCMVQNLFCISFLSGLPEPPIFEISGSSSGSYQIPLPLLILILILIFLLILIVILILIPLPLLLQLLLLVLILLEVLAKPALNKKRRKLNDKKCQV